MYDREKILTQFKWQTTSLETRFPFYIPKKLKKAEINQRNIVRKDKYFKITVSKTLTQEHRDMLDIILSHTKYDPENDRYFAYIPLPKLRKLIPSTKATNWLEEKLQEITETVVYVRRKKDERTYQEISLNIISNYYREWKKNGAKGFLIVVLDKAYCKLFEVTTAINYKNLIDDIVAIDDLAVKGVVRYCLSQKEFVNKDLFEILETLGYDQNIKNNKKKAQRLKKRFEDASKNGTLGKFNLNYNRKTNKIIYHRLNASDVFQSVKKKEDLVEAYQSLINSAQKYKEYPALPKPVNDYY